MRRFLNFLIFVCPDCEKVFGPLRVLQTYRAEQDNFRHPARSLVADASTCRVCLRLYQGRPNIIRHLREDKKPGIRILESYQALLASEITLPLDALEEAERRAARQQSDSARPATCGPHVCVSGPLRRLAVVLTT